ncbi:hypothetical protein [Branchiibius cervicis]|uniref:Uncharacterized protein n=1 Tax=Branchiibius cervicis TaxID=908252 RepID=A0ABW2AR84_9MICO
MNDAAPSTLLESLVGLRRAVVEVRLPLQIDGVQEARRQSEELTAQLDDYLIPRASALDAPCWPLSAVPPVPASRRWSTRSWATRSPRPGCCGLRPGLPR